MPKWFHFVLSCSIAAFSEINPNLPLDRPFTLLNPEPSLLEAEYDRIITGRAEQSFIFPRPCISALDSSRVCPENDNTLYSDSAKTRTVRITPLIGYEYRYQGDNAHAADFGLVTDGGMGPISFYLDARMFVELYDNLYHASYDREFVERQDEKASGSVAYSSYSRYRSNLSYDWSWGRLSVARDAAHWGPGLFTNLVFQQNAVPFNQLTFTSHLGPISVQSLYGQLAASRDWEFDTTSQAKSLYAHRYEWRVTENLLLGLSEQLILYKTGAPFAFAPFVPLFIAKASEKERLNNGNIAADVCYRFAGLGRIYAEFLIDDIQSPTALFNDDWSNKWAVMAGAQASRESMGIRYGAILECSRVEPWVYTHYLPHTAQTANLDYPLGNPWGPNSQAVIAKLYLAREGNWHVSFRAEAVWKGTDVGSNLEDIHGTADTMKKRFLYGVDAPAIQAGPEAQWRWRRMDLRAGIAFGAELEGGAGIRFWY
jgi:hypothetical protein